jgi:hypothetical protein
MKKNENDLEKSSLESEELKAKEEEMMSMRK